MKHIAIFSAFLVVAAPVLAFEIEEIGTMAATFGDEQIAQPTVIARDGDEASSTAFLVVPGGGFSSLSLAGYGSDNARLGVDVTFMSEAPTPETAPIEAIVTYSPQGTGLHWTSEGAPEAISIVFTALTSAGDETRATGTFSGQLCYAEGYGSEADANNCRAIEGSFDTPITIE